MSFMLQGNPANFEIRTYLKQPMIYWSVNRYIDKITMTDHVFIWESGPSGGVIAYGIVCELVTPRKTVIHPDLLGTHLWSNQAPDESSLVVGVQIIRSIHNGYYISRDVAKADADLASLDVLRMPQGTVYQCSDSQVIRLLRG
jgi:hypothetical protein